MNIKDLRTLLSSIESQLDEIETSNDPEVCLNAIQGAANEAMTLEDELWELSNNVEDELNLLKESNETTED